MRENSIYFVPIGGLCNRMRAMASSVYVATKMGCPITVYWNKNKECFADFSDLFKPVVLDNVTLKPYTCSDSYLALARKRNLYIPSLIRHFMFDRQLVEHACLSDDEIDGLRGRIYIISGSFVANCCSLKSLFVPTLEIQEQINLLSAQFSEHVCGIHIRRTDNDKSIQKNEIADYLRYMDGKVETCPDVRFFLATDSTQVKQLMSDRYGDRLLSHPAKLERTSIQGMKDAVVDLWCLSLTKEIIGSFHSSYSEIAAELGGIELKILE